jgi:hypothetical protein
MATSARDDRNLGRVERSDALYRRLYWLLPLTFVVIAASLAIDGIRVSHHWSWPLFGWGAAVGIVGAIVIEAATWFVSHRTELTAVNRARLDARRPIYVGAWLGGGCIVGAVAAIFRQGWIDVVGAAYSALCILAGLILAAAAKRRIS